uniref:Uncharacterized protein n=1 Tax=Triparma laevis TaxID=1534972 RepID=A0A0K2RWF7_9STRA|nr:hypothetical protein AL373_mgp07 [Triparma laevis]BAS19181.1 hypothetical protein [Triparma laevis]
MSISLKYQKFNPGTNLLKLLEFNKFRYKNRLESGANNTWYYNSGSKDKYILNDNQLLEGLPISGNVISNSYLSKDLRTSLLTEASSLNNNSEIQNFILNKQENSLKLFTQKLNGLKKLFLLKSLKQLDVFAKSPIIFKKGFLYQVKSNEILGTTVFVHAGGRSLKKIKKLPKNLKYENNEKIHLKFLSVPNKNLIRMSKLRVKFRRKPLNFWKKQQNPFPRTLKIIKIGSVKEPLKQIFSRNLEKLSLDSVISKKKDSKFDSTLFTLKTKTLIKSFC